MSDYIEFAVRVPKDEADVFIARFKKGNVKILGYLLGEEIVRCRDCRFGVEDGVYYCTIDSLHRSDWRNVEPDGFCKWAKERRQ